MKKNIKRTTRDPLAEIVKLAQEIEAESQEFEKQITDSVTSLKDRVKRTKEALEIAENDFKSMEKETQEQFERAFLAFLEEKSEEG